ncbi:MAG: TolC family protein [Thermodesulfobacteriota bacterium]
MKKSLWPFALLLLLFALFPGALRAGTAGSSPGPYTDAFLSVPAPGDGDQLRPRLSLPEAIQIALRNNRNVKSAYLERVVQKFNLKVSEYKFVPGLSLDAGADYSEQRQSGSPALPVKTSELSAGPSVSGTVPTGATYNFSWAYDDGKTENGAGSPGSESQSQSTWSVSFSQPLLKGGGITATMASVRQARIRERQNILSLKTTLMEKVLQVITAYRGLISAAERVKISEASLKSTREQLAINRLLIATGRMAETDIIETEASLARQEFSRQQELNALDQARQSLIQVMDMDPGSRFTLEDLPEPASIEPDYARCLETAYESRPAYLQGILNVESLDVALAVAENEQLWDLSLTAVYGNTNSQGTLLYEPGSESYDIGLALHIPLFGTERLGIRQQLLQAKSDLEKSKLALAKSKDDLAIQVGDAVRNVNSQLVQMGLAEKSRMLAEKKLQNEMVKLKLGRSANFTVVQYQNDLVSAQNSELSAKIGYLNSLSALDDLIGTALDTWNIDFDDERGKMESIARELLDSK